MSASPDRVEWMVDLVRNGEIPVFVRRAYDFEPADLADVLAALDEDERLAVVQALPPELSSQALAETAGGCPRGADARGPEPGARRRDRRGAGGRRRGRHPP